MPATRPLALRSAAWRESASRGLELRPRGRKPTRARHRLEIEIGDDEHDQRARVLQCVLLGGNVVIPGPEAVQRRQIEHRLRQADPRVEDVERTDQLRQTREALEPERGEVDDLPRLAHTAHRPWAAARSGRATARRRPRALPAPASARRGCAAALSPSRPTTSATTAARSPRPSATLPLNGAGTVVCCAAALTTDTAIMPTAATSRAIPLPALTSPPSFLAVCASPARSSSRRGRPSAFGPANAVPDRFHEGGRLPLDRSPSGNDPARQTTPLARSTVAKTPRTVKSPPCAGRRRAFSGGAVTGRQYFGCDGSTLSIQLRMPPWRLSACGKPCSRRNATAFALRPPTLQWTTSGRDGIELGDALRQLAERDHGGPRNAADLHFVRLADVEDHADRPCDRGAP